MELVGGGYVINEAYPVYFFVLNCSNFSIFVHKLVAASCSQSVVAASCSQSVLEYFFKLKKFQNMFIAYRIALTPDVKIKWFGCQKALLSPIGITMHY